MPGLSFQKMRPAVQALVALGFVVSGLFEIYYFVARYLAPTSYTHQARSSLRLVAESATTLVFGLLFLGLGLYAMVKRVQQHRDKNNGTETTTNLEDHR